MEEKINHKIVGFDRIEAVDNRISISESIVRIINSVVKTNIERYSVLINFNDGIEITISSRKEMSIELNSEIDIRNNLLIMATAKIAKKVVIIINKHNKVIERKINFNNINYDYIQEQIQINDNNKNINKNSVIFRILKQDLREDTANNIYKRSNITNIARYLGGIYSNGIQNGFKIMIYYNNKSYAKELSRLSLKGVLVNKDAYIINKKCIKIYKSYNENKGIELLINNIKVSNRALNSLIEWNREPFKKNGYSFKRLFIEVSIFQDDFDLNDEQQIANVSSNLIKEIEETMLKNIDSFESDIVNINLEYNKKDMKEICKRTSQNSSAEATKMVLDEYLKKD